MPLSIRLFLVGVALFGVGHLATPGPALAEPDTSAVWMEERSAEPALAVPVDAVGPASSEPRAATDDGGIAPDVDLWAEFFLSTPTSSASVTAPEPARQPALTGRAIASAPSTSAK